MKNSSQQGFSILGVLMVASLLGFVALGVLQISKIMNSLQNNAQSNLDLQILKNDLISILKNGQYCTVSLAGNDPVGSPVIFRKTDIDNMNTEGLDVELWLSDVNGTARTLKKYSATDPNVNTFGKIQITKLQLVMDGAPTGVNFPNGVSTEKGNLKLEVQKSGIGDRVLRSTIPVSVSISTTSGNSTIQSCSSDMNGLNDKYLVIHSQSTTVPTCPAGWSSESTGYSYLLSRIHEATEHYEDLGDTGSCLSRYGNLVYIECENNQCDYNSPNDFDMWLWSGTGTSASRCNICKKPSAVIKVFHSQSSTVPACPAGMNELWNGYSLLLLSFDPRTRAPMRLDSTGSCLRDIKNGIPFLECTISSCEHLTGGDFSLFLTSRVGTPDVGGDSPIDMSKIGRCSVCQSD